eukprot:scaffold2085_cov263-Pinguiococcus_pyrenoidosus.AAC.13
MSLSTQILLRRFKSLFLPKSRQFLADLPQIPAFAHRNSRVLGRISTIFQHAAPCDAILYHDCAGVATQGSDGDGPEGQKRLRRPPSGATAGKAVFFGGVSGISGRKACIFAAALQFGRLQAAAEGQNLRFDGCLGAKAAGEGRTVLRAGVYGRSTAGISAPVLQKAPWKGVHSQDGGVHVRLGISAIGGAESPGVERDPFRAARVPRGSRRAAAGAGDQLGAATQGALCRRSRVCQRHGGRGRFALPRDPARRYVPWHARSRSGGVVDGMLLALLLSAFSCVGQRAE